ncbi:uncharacterized protein FIBRA_04696 [Fibroporia radiculosa]|uniref:DUF8191 domain-containing protein n=1 Tax=Fibroporia radiculosa TaxID=599839 RepID=J4G7T1_9APHY|nr:uncharacterized protein FIBRA_04696 [Fibroporia radiculosa]CCM02593.1 predicted protein [Fibroporia radiculosa]
MPSSFLAPLQSTYRRTTASSRQRENRSQLNSQTSSMRRRKSRSPDVRMLEDVTTARNDTGGRKKKKHAASAFTSSEAIGGDDTYDSRGRKPKAKPRTQSIVEDVDVPDGPSASGSTSSRSKRRDRSKSREASHRLSKRTVTPEPSDYDIDSCQFASASGELQQLKAEVDKLRKTLSGAKRSMQNQSQGWFRTAPPGDDEMYDDDDVSRPLIHRKKTCPCCRTTVGYRPIPLFVVKSLASVLEKAKVSPNTPPHATPPPEEDPWAGIFPTANSYLHGDDWSGNGYGDEDEDADYDDEDEDDDYDEDDDDLSFDGYGTPEDDEPYDGPYVHPRWAPPTVHIMPDDYPFDISIDLQELVLLRRGASLQMIDMYSMAYTHGAGIRATVDNMNIIYLGWNIELRPDDETGEEYMEWIQSDMDEHPERWEIEYDHNGSWVAWKLVPPDEDDEYECSDSDYYVEQLNGEDDL